MVLFFSFFIFKLSLLAERQSYHRIFIFKKMSSMGSDQQMVTGAAAAS